MAYIRQPQETTAQWLERLVGMQAPVDIRADVQALLENERGRLRCTLQILNLSSDTFLPRCVRSFFHHFSMCDIVSNALVWFLCLPSLILILWMSACLVLVNVTISSQSW